MSAEAKMDKQDWALVEPVKACEAQITFEELDVTDPWYKEECYKKYHHKNKNENKNKNILLSKNMVQLIKNLLYYLGGSI